MEEKKEAVQAPFQPNMAQHGMNYSPALSAAEFAKREDAPKTVTMNFPHRVLLQLNTREILEFKPGPNEVPEAEADHPYLKAHGVTRYAPHAVGVPAVALQPEDVERIKAEQAKLKQEPIDEDLKAFVEATEVSGANEPAVKETKRATRKGKQPKSNQPQHPGNG